MPDHERWTWTSLFASHELEMLEYEVALLREQVAVRGRMEVSSAGQLLGSLRDHESLFELEDATKAMGAYPPCRWWVECPEAWASPRREWP